MVPWAASSELIISRLPCISVSVTSTYSETWNRKSTEVIQTFWKL